jgi:hypothetical protein
MSEPHVEPYQCPKCGGGMGAHTTDCPSSLAVRTGSVCGCADEYTFEPHGDGWALYLGRCQHRHGWNLANIREPDMPRLTEMLRQLNTPNTAVRHGAQAPLSGPTGSASDKSP